MPRPPRHNRPALPAPALALFRRRRHLLWELEPALALFRRRRHLLWELEPALDMCPGNLYVAFDSKEALCREAPSTCADLGRRALERALARADSPLVRLASHLHSSATCRPPPGPGLPMAHSVNIASP